MIGQTLAHYRIVAKLGEGGMGVVWKALDTRLEREVAIKVLPEALAEDADHLARFEREAKLLATLNHRNIAAIYGLEEAGGRRFLVMELIEGQDLARRLAAGPLAVRESLELCQQLARALEAAHDKGVLHRDLKPANVLVTPEGRAKVLDFGLAKMLEDRVDPTKSPTLTSAGTRVGAVLGTAGYMSPEQARGKPLDKRTDIWSFGCVLYECLTGRGPFRGETVSDTLAAILKTEADWTLLPNETPPRVRELLERCLEKDSKNRLRDIGDARIELERSLSGRESLSDVSGAVPLATGRRRRRFSSRMLVAAALAGMLIGALARSLSGGGDGTRVTRLSFRHPPDLILEDQALLAPDAATILFSARPRQSSGSDQDPQRLYLRRLDRFEVQPVVGSEGVVAATFSPDGRWIAMLTPVTPRSTQRRLQKVPVDRSAPPLNLMDWPQGWRQLLLWLPDGDILAAVDEPRSIVRIPSDGSPAKAPIEIKNEGFEGQFFFSPKSGSVLPDGVHVLGGASIFAQRGFDLGVAVLDTKTGVARMLIENGSSPQWSPTGQLLFARGDTLLAVPFDLAKLVPTGSQLAITDGLRAGAIWQDASFQLAAGTLLHSPGGLVGGSRRLAILDRERKVVGSWSDDRRPFEAGVKISPDGRRLAVSIVDAQGLYTTWVSDVDRPSLTQLVRRTGEDCIPQLFSATGDRLVYGCQSTTSGALYIGPGDGSREPRMLLKYSATEGYAPNAFLPGESALILTHGSSGKSELLLLPLGPPTAQGEATPIKLLDDAADASVSPDGRLIAYQSSSSGRSEIYLRPIEAGGRLGPVVPVTRSGGFNPSWYRGVGAAPLELEYENRSRVFGVTVTTEPRLSISEPRPVSGDLTELFWKVEWPPANLPDGRSIVILRGDDEEPPSETSVVLNWSAELERRLAETR